MSPATLKSKVCLVGDLAVGKTSLIRRYVLDAFDDAYITTLGTKVSKKTVELAQPGQPEALRVDMMIWDIMGQHAFQELLKDSYFFGVRGIIAVADLTRRETLDDIDLWVDLVEGVAGEVPMLLVVNKADLQARAAYSKEEIQAVADRFECQSLLTSAKTGQGIEDAFRRLAELVAAFQMGLPDHGE